MWCSNRLTAVQKYLVSKIAPSKIFVNKKRIPKDASLVEMNFG